MRRATPPGSTIEHTLAYLDLAGSCHSFVATPGRPVPRLRELEFAEDERNTVCRQIGRIRAAGDGFEVVLDNREFTLGEQPIQLLKDEWSRR